MGISSLNKIKAFGSELFDSVLGAEQPKIYYDPNGKIKRYSGEIAPAQAKISAHTVVKQQSCSSFIF